MEVTLVNTEPHWMAGQHALAPFHGVTWTEIDALAPVGRPMPIEYSTNVLPELRVDTGGQADEGYFNSMGSARASAVVGRKIVEGMQ